MEWNLSDIISACKKQDKQAQMALFRYYHEKFYGICLRYLHKEEVAEEVLMDAFMKIFQKIDLYKDGSFEGWMKTIVIHQSIDYYRKHKSDPFFAEVDYELKKTPSNKTSESMEAEELMQMLNHLPAGYRMVFNMYAIEGYQHKEIAEKLGISISTSKTQYLKARKKLQEMLKEGGYDG
jgi:RNA polymerase sigma-70 factor (ECF subfamily)